MLSAGVAWLAACGEMAFPIRLAERELPKVDGNIAAHEYDEGVCIPGFLKCLPESQLVPGNEGTATFLTDGRTLYVAWRVKARNIDIGGGLDTRATQRDGAVWADDAVELTVSDESSPKRIAHFIINSIGTIYDMMTVPSGKPDGKWNCKDIKVASRVANGWWEMEASVPFASIGRFEKGFYANAARSLQGEGAASLTAASAYIEGPKIRFDWRKDATAVGMSLTGVPAEGTWNPEFSVTAGKSRVKAAFSLTELLKNGDDGETLFTDSKIIGVGETFSPQFATRSRKLLRADLSLRDEKTDELLLSRRFFAMRGIRTSSVPASAEFDIGTVGEVAIYHYPGLNRVRCTLYPSMADSVQAVKCSVGGTTGNLRRQEDGSYSTIMPAPEAAGRYPVSFDVQMTDGKSMCFADVWTLEKRRFEWEGHKIGLERVIVPPFKAIAGSGGVLDVIKRRYRFGGACLPASIETEGRELLVEPVRFEAVVDGKAITLDNVSSKVQTAADGYDATLEGTVAGGGLTICGKGIFEYDGFAHARYSLAGLNGRILDRLTLVVPLKDAEVPLMHVCMTDSLRYNPAGTVPAGEGEVWNSTKLKHPRKFKFRAPQIAPYVWLGAERRGLSWFVNNTCGFRLREKESAIRLVRRGGVLRLEVDIVNEPSHLADGHSFAFGFEATPVKDADPALRKHFQTGPGQHPAGMISRQEINYVGTGFWNTWARRPYGDDWRLFEAACRLSNRAAPGDKEAYRAILKEVIEAHDKELQEYCKPLPKIGKSTPYYLWMKGCRMSAAAMICAPGEVVYPFKYSDPTLNWKEEESQKAYRSEWVSRPNQYTGAERNFITPTYLEYCLYYYKKQMNCGMKGIYLDDMFPMTCRNPDTECRVDSDGSVHGNFGILEMRELIKRLSVMQHLAGLSPRLIQVHMTNCLLVPSFAFATSQLSWEDHFGEDEFQKRFKDDYIRAESLGGQIGAEAVALDGIKRHAHPKEGWDARFRFLTRTQQAILLPAGVKIWLRPPWPPDTGVHKEELFSILDVPGRFGAWEDDCTFTPYHAYDGSAGAMPQGIHVGTWRRGGGILWVFGNQTAKNIEITVIPTGERLTVPAYDLRFAQSAGKQ